MAKVESGIPHNLRKVDRRLQRWRSLHTGPLPIPERLWAAAGRAMAGLLAVFAEFEREVLQERVRASLAHARQNGKRLGRPPTAVHKHRQLRDLYRAGVSKAEIARQLQIGRTSVRRILKERVRP